MGILGSFSLTPVRGKVDLAEAEVDGNDGHEKGDKSTHVTHFTCSEIEEIFY